MKEYGFTLIEAVICMAILCILAGLTYPNVEKWKSKFALHGEVSTLVGELHRARFAAIRSNSYAVFSYDQTGYKSFLDNGTGGGKREDWVRQPGEQLLAEVIFDGLLKIVIAESTFTLNRTRFSSRAGVKAGSIVLQDVSGHKTKIIVSAVGRVRTEKL